MINQIPSEIRSIQALFLATRFLDSLVVSSDDIGLVNDAGEPHVIGVIDHRHTATDEFLGLGGLYQSIFEDWIMRERIQKI